MILPGMRILQAEEALQRPLVSADGGHAVQVAVVDGVLQRMNDLLFPHREMRSGEIGGGDGVVRDKRAVAIQVNDD